MVETAVFDFYRQYGINSNPEPCAEMLADLPESLPALCTLIKKQLIHPADRYKYKRRLPPGLKNEDKRFITVAQMLATLQKRDVAGLTMARKPKDRLLVSCRYHALLLAAILKTQDIPARIRVGFANYVSPNKMKYVDHWLCEVWQASEQRWIFVDPDKEVIDVSPTKFRTASYVWLGVRKHFISPDKFGVGRFWGWEPIRQNLIHDFEACLNIEPVYWQGPPLFKVQKAKLKKQQLQLLDEVAELLQNPDTNLAKLQELQQVHPELQR